MGLGKTFQSICTMWVLLTTGLTGRPTCSRALIITPTSLVANWGGHSRATWALTAQQGRPHRTHAASMPWQACLGDALHCSRAGPSLAASPLSSCSLTSATPCSSGREVDKWLGGRLRPVVVEDATQLKVRRRGGSA